MKYLLILLLTGCAAMPEDLVYQDGNKLVIEKYHPTMRGILNNCGIGRYGCTRYTPSVNTYVVHTLPVDCLVEHERKHVKNMNWHPPGWVDVECNKKVRMYLGG